jgi:hypothetical protein
MKKRENNNSTFPKRDRFKKIRMRIRFIMVAAKRT